MSDQRSSQSEPPARGPGTAGGTASGTGTSTSRSPGTPRDANKYRDRPSEDGKQGDAAQQPNAGFPHDD